MRPGLEIELLKLLVRYEPDTGRLFWLPRTSGLFKRSQDCALWNKRNAGTECFLQSDGLGYRRGAIFKQKYRAHQIAWALTFGQWPKEIDHIDGDRSNNRIDNLRNVGRRENCRNLRRPRHNRSGVVGVSWDQDRSKWQAGIHVDGRAIALGRFVAKADAIAARRAAEREHDFHPNHGRA
jgi:hypothetical protein